MSFYKTCCLMYIDNAKKAIQEACSENPISLLNYNDDKHKNKKILLEMRKDKRKKEQILDDLEEEDLIEDNDIINSIITDKE